MIGLVVGIVISIAGEGNLISGIGKGEAGPAQGVVVVVSQKIAVAI